MNWNPYDRRPTSEGSQMRAASYLCWSNAPGYDRSAIPVHAATQRSGSEVRSATIAASLLLAAPCVALECPTAQPAGAPGALQETPAQISELSQVLASGDLGNRIPLLVHALHSRHPDVAHRRAGELPRHGILPGREQPDGPERRREAGPDGCFHHPGHSGRLLAERRMHRCEAFV